MARDWLCTLWQRAEKRWICPLSEKSELIRYVTMAENLGTRFRKLYTAVYEFLTEKGIETQDESTSSKLRRFSHFWLLAIKSFNRNKGPLRATALAYTTLFSLVPILAISVSVTTT